MTNYINGLLQEVLETNNNYDRLAEAIYDYITRNDESMYNYIIDAMQMLILQQTDKFIVYQDCENMYLAIKGFESIYDE